MPFAFRRSLIVLALCGLALAQDPAAQEEAAFKEAAKEAESKCPISNALRGSLAIELDVQVK